MTQIWAVIPIKRLDGAKQRLARVLDAETRAGLMRAMAADVLRAATEAPGLAGIVVVAGDEAGERLARDAGVASIRDRACSGQSDAVARGVDYIGARGAAALLALPADIPLATAAEMGRVAARAAATLSRGPARSMILVPARDGDGSNAVAVAPPSALRFHFGPDSRRRHLAAAAALALDVDQFDLPGIGLDIDTPDDLAELLGRPGCGQTHAFLADAGIAHRLAEALAPPVAAQ